MKKKTIKPLNTTHPEPPGSINTCGLPFPIHAFVQMAVARGVDAHDAECDLRLMCREKGIEINEHNSRAK